MGRRYKEVPSDMTVGLAIGNRATQSLGYVERMTGDCFDMLLHEVACGDQAPHDMWEGQMVKSPFSIFDLLRGWRLEAVRETMTLGFNNKRICHCVETDVLEKLY